MHQDYWGPFTRTLRRNKYILLAICLFTKHKTAKAVQNATALAAAQFQVNNMVVVHGWVKEILTDWGTHFTEHMMREILRLMDVKHLLTTFYHAQADGAGERALKTFIYIISHYTSTCQSNWDQVINFAVFTMNIVESKTAGFTPSEIVFVRPPVFPIVVALGYDGFQETEWVSEYTLLIRNW